MRRYLPNSFTLSLLCTVALGSLLPAQGSFAGYLGTFTDFAIALLFFLHGARLSYATVRAGLLHWRLQLVVLAVTFGIFPLLGLAVGQLPETILPRELYLGVLYLCLLPSTVQSSIAFTSMAGGNVPAAICAASASNILGVFVTPLLVGLLFSLGGGGAGFSFGGIEKILLQLLAPFVLGQLLQPWIGGWVRGHKNIVTPVDRGSILLVVYAAFSAGMVAGIWSRFGLESLALVIGLDVLMLAVVLLLTTHLSRWFGFSTEDEIAIVFCGSKKSMAAGLPMANILFPASAVGLIILPLMLFHQVQLFACATLAQRYARRGADRREAAPALAS